MKELRAIVQKSGDRITVNKKGHTLLDIAIFQVDNIAVIGNVQVTTQALHMLMQNGVDISCFSRSGTYQKNEPYQTYTMPSGEMEEVI